MVEPTQPEAELYRADFHSAAVTIQGADAEDSGRSDGETWTEGQTRVEGTPSEGSESVGHPLRGRVVRERVMVKSPVRENRPPGSVRRAPGNRRPYRDPPATGARK